MAITVSATVCCVVAIAVPSGRSKVTVTTLVLVTDEHEDIPDVVAQLLVVSRVVVTYTVVCCVLISVVVYVVMQSEAERPASTQASIVEVTSEVVV